MKSGDLVWVPQGVDLWHSESDDWRVLNIEAVMSEPGIALVRDSDPTGFKASVYVLTGNASGKTFQVYTKNINLLKEA